MITFSSHWNSREDGANEPCCPQCTNEELLMAPTEMCS